MASSRVFSYPAPDGGTERVRALTVFLVNHRVTAHKFYADVSYAFQARVELICPSGFRPRRDLSGYRSQDWDLRVADLHYSDVCEYAVGRNAAAAWDTTEERSGTVTRVWTDPLPSAEVERVAPNEDETLKARVTFGMEILARLADSSGAALRQGLAELPDLYMAWIKTQHGQLGPLAPRRKETAERLIADMETANRRIADGIDILANDASARSAFRFMNLAVAAAARRRSAGPADDPEKQDEPTWRPFQLAFILLNLAGLVHDLRHSHITWLCQQEVHPKMISERAGHASISITMDLYSHVMPGMDGQAAKKIDQAFRRLRTPPEEQTG